MAIRAAGWTIIRQKRLSRVQTGTEGCIDIPVLQSSQSNITKHYEINPFSIHNKAKRRKPKESKISSHRKKYR
jgi:hypothetical protein